MFSQSDLKGCRRGEQAFLEQLQNEFTGKPLLRGSGVLGAQRGVFLKGSVAFPFLLCVRNLQVFDPALGKPATAIPS